MRTSGDRTRVSPDSAQCADPRLSPRLRQRAGRKISSQRQRTEHSHSCTPIAELSGDRKSLTPLKSHSRATRQRDNSAGREPALWRNAGSPASSSQRGLIRVVGTRRSARSDTVSLDRRPMSAACLPRRVAYAHLAGVTPLARHVTLGTLLSEGEHHDETCHSRCRGALRPRRRDSWACRPERCASGGVHPSHHISCFG